MMKGPDAVIGDGIVQGAMCTYNWFGNLHRNWRYWSGGYGTPVEQRPGFTNVDLFNGVPATFDANDNETTDPPMLVAVDDGSPSIPQPEMVVCTNPHTTVHQLSLLYQVNNVEGDNGDMMAPPSWCTPIYKRR